MRKQIKSIDHVVIAVRDLDSTRDSFRRVGFTLTPRDHHILGSQNNCVMFGQDYLELLMVPQRLPGREYYYDFALTGYGPHNTSRLRRFAISALNLHAKPGDSIASMTRRLASKTRLVFDYLLTTKNSTGHAAPA